MRRPADQGLIPNEERVLLAVDELTTEGHPALHGYLIAGQLRHMRPHRRVMAYSTLYRCLDRLVERGYLAATTADDPTATTGGAPRKHFEITPNGQSAAIELRRSGVRWRPDLGLI